MIVIVNSKTYETPNSKGNDLRKMAKTLVPRGIYAVQRGNTLELRKDMFGSKSEMKAAIKSWNSKGFTAFWNWG